MLATKYVNPRGEGPNDRGASRRYTIKAVEASLKRLGTDYIDLIYLHREDHNTPVAETVRVLGELIQQGKLRSYGLSNHRAWKIAEFSNVADKLNVDRPRRQPAFVQSGQPPAGSRTPGGL